MRTSVINYVDQFKLQGFCFLEECPQLVGKSMNCLHHQNRPMNGCTMHPSLTIVHPFLSSKEHLEVNKNVGNSDFLECLVFFEVEDEFAEMEGRTFVDNQVLK